MLLTGILLYTFSHSYSDFNVKSRPEADMDPSEIEFIAEKESITVVPNFSQDKIYLIGGDIGPFNPGLPVEIPLWLAVNLKQRQKCRIIPPG